MKLLFYRYGSICEPFILDALAQLGIKVTELTPEMSNKNMLPSEVVAAVNNFPHTICRMVGRRSCNGAVQQICDKPMQLFVFI